VRIGCGITSTISSTARCTRETSPCREVGHSGTQDRLHRSRRPMGGQVVRRHRQDGGENHLLIDFHGAFKPTGLGRTWPNQITREGITGQRIQQVERQGNARNTGTASLHARAGGTGDYTPGGFANRQPGSSTALPSRPRCKPRARAELAMFIPDRKPLHGSLRFARGLQGQRWQVSAWHDFLKGLPTVWDETRGLAGEVGKYVVEARATGRTGIWRRFPTAMGASYPCR